MSALPLEEIPPLGPNEARLYLNNLPWSYTNEMLATWVQQESGVRPIDVQIVQNRKLNRSRGYGFVKIQKNDLGRALGLDGKIIELREIGVQEAKQRTDDERIAEREQKRIVREQRKAQRESAPKEERASAAAKPAELAVQREKREPREPRAPKVAIKTFPDATTLWVTNLNFSVDEAQLRVFFTQSLGVEPLDVSIPMKHGKGEARSMGYGFVVLPNSKIDAGLALDGQEYVERPLKISLARVPAASSSPTTERQDGAEQQGPRPPRRRGGAGRGTGGNKTETATAPAAGANGSAPPSASTSASAPEGAAPRRPRNRGRRPPRVGAEDGAL